MVATDEGFYVSDGNHNRIYFVALDGEVTEVIAWGNTVPTGLALGEDGTLYVAEIGPVPHTPEEGRIIAVDVEAGESEVLASGISYLIGLAFGEDGTLYAVSMGDEPDENTMAPAVPFSGKLIRVEANGDLTVLVDGFMLTTSLDIADDTAFLVGLSGEVWKVEGVSELDEYVPPTPVPTEVPTEAPTQQPTAVPTATSVPPTATIPAPRPPATGSGMDGTSTTTWTLGAIALLMLAAGGSLAISTSRRKG